MVRQTWGSLVSPGSVRVPYPSAVQCTYTIELPEEQNDQPLSIHFSKFDVAADDFVQVFEGSSKGRSLHEGAGFNNEQRPPQQLVSRLGKAQLVLQTNAVRNAMGFNATFSLS
ncbi:CUB domain protein [Oesophagostomum dentatum]|uniref:CUB domain protein n=1 Tax=Oesophagostomum dentatum TaxID=61180 RepID=A0A0B1S9W3_OESDE|nr:CUB domain protein [Oesophagostomum dentatum]